MVEDRRKRVPNRRLDTWKEIASYFGRDERTVKRWEKDRGLPVRRLPGAHGGVYANTDDLAQWMATRDRAGSDSGQSGSVRNQPVNVPVTASGASYSGEVAVIATGVESVTEPAAVAKSGGRRLGWALGLGLLVLAAAGVAVFSIGRATASFGKPMSGGTQATSSQHVPSPAAQNLYLQGRYYFQQAIASDHDYALAYVGLAECYNRLREYAAMPEDEAYQKAIAAAKKAVELDDSLADAHNSLGFDLFYGALDVPGAEREFQTALKLNPNCELAHHWYATYLVTVGRSREALQQIEIARQLNSSSTSILADKGLILYYAGHTGEAIALLKQVEETEPSFLSSHRYLGLIDLMTGKYDEYLGEARKAAVLSKNEVEAAIVDAAAKGFRNGGVSSMLRARLGKELKFFVEGRLPAYRLAQTYSLMNQRQEAIDYLRVSHNRHESALSGVLVDPAFGNLRNNPSY